MITPTKEFWDVFKKTEGALSCTEAVCIMNIANQVPENAGEYVELGVYYGKSAISALQGLPTGEFTLVDPIFEDVQIVRNVWNTILQASNGVKHYIIDQAKTSVEVLHNKRKSKLSYIFVDSGSHQDGLPMQEAKMLEDLIVKGGIIAWHDWNSQFSEVKQASDYLVCTGKYEYIPIDWGEIITYVNENNLEEGNNSWHHTELKNPCFVGAVKRI